MALTALLCACDAEAGITPNKAGTNLYDFVFDDVPLSNVVMDVSRVGGPNVICRRDDLRGNITLNMTAVEWMPALCSILDMHGLELLERTPGSGIYSVSAKMNSVGMTDLLFHAPGSAPSTNHISLNLTDAPLKQLLLEIARKGHVNIRYPSDLGDTGKFTIGLEDVECEAVLTHLLTLCNLNVYKSPRLNAYVILDGFPPAASPPSSVYTSSPSTGDKGVSDAVGFGVIACIISWFLLLHVFRGTLRRDLMPLASDAALAKAKVKTFWGSLFLLCLIYGFTIGTTCVWGSEDPAFRDGGLGMAFVVGSVAMCALFLLLVLAIRLCRRFAWLPQGRWRLATWGVALLPMLFILTDSLPLWHDYQWTDLPTPRNHAKESHRWFERLCGTNGISLHLEAPHLGSAEIVTNTLAYSTEIEGAWKDMEEGRGVVERLNAFDGIDEAIEIPTWDLDTPMRSYKTVRAVFQTYHAYALLKAAEGNPAEGAKQISELHSVVRKALPYAKTLVRKMTLVAMARGNVEVAWQIARSPHCTPEVLAVLRDAFPPLPHEDVSLRWTLMAEYLVMKDLCKNKITNAKFIDSFPLFRVGEIVGGSGSGKVEIWKPTPSGFWMRNVSRVLAFMFFKRNSTVRDLRAHCDLLIAGADKHPPDFAAAGEYCERYARRPKLTNLGGWLFVTVATPSFSRAQATTSQTKALSDLLAMEIHHRLGRGIELRDYYTGGNYLFAEKTGTYSSAGPDGKQGTKDDLTLGHWPP